MRIGLAFQAFFKALFDAQAATSIEAALTGKALPAPRDEAAQPTAKVAPKPAAAARSDALTLLATLQREARFVDIVKEPLGDYNDAQIGAAARDVLRDCGNVLERLFALRAIEEREEGASIEVPAGFEAGRYRLTGKVQGDPPFRGSLAHHGWQASKCDVPKWTGSEADRLVVAPAEVEVK